MHLKYLYHYLNYILHFIIDYDIFLFFFYKLDTYYSFLSNLKYNSNENYVHILKILLCFSYLISTLDHVYLIFNHDQVYLNIYNNSLI